MERWSGRVALVTGASVGIGAAICRKLAENGMKVVACARNFQQIQDIAKEFPSGAVLPVRCDLEKEEEILAMFEEIRAKFGRIDVCVNNAGFATKSDLITARTEEWRGMLNVNVLALCICTRESIKLMQEKGIDDGQIIHISSIGGHEIIRNSSFYCGTKFMVQALTEALRKELTILKSHIRVASIGPGFVKTEFIERAFENKELADKLLSSMDPLQPEDISEVVISILRMPAHVDINDVVLRPLDQY